MISPMTHSAAILTSFTDISYSSACYKMDFQGKLLGDRPLCVFPFGTKPCKPIGCADFLKIKRKVAIVVEIRILRLERIIRFSSFTVSMSPKGRKVLKNPPFINDDSFFSVKFVVEAFFIRLTKRCQRFFLILAAKA